MHAGSSLSEFRKIQHLMNGFFGLNHRGMLGIHIVSVGRDEMASGVSSVATINEEILHAQTADGRRHPAILAAMIMNAANLSDIPTDGHDFEELTFVNQVSCVVAFCVKKIRRECLGLNSFLRCEIEDSRNRKFGFRNGAKVLYPFVDR